MAEPEHPFCRRCGIIQAPTMTFKCHHLHGCIQRQQEKAKRQRKFQKQRDKHQLKSKET